MQDLLTNRSILLTGVTGLIGGELTSVLHDETSSRLFTLVRPRPDRGAEARLAERLQRSGCDISEFSSDRLAPVAGDLGVAQLGLGDRVHSALTREVDLIIHCAAETSFIRDDQCHRINVEGMRHLLEFARSCSRKPLFVHVSTATVCGALSHCDVTEDGPCDPNGAHYNEYTRSKALAEQMLRASGIPSLVLRPSITISAGLRDPAFARAILWFLPLLNELDAVPIDPMCRLDVVPVSFVVQSMVRLLKLPRHEYDCYHLSAGAEAALSLGEAGRFVDYFYDREEPLKLVSPAGWSREVHRRYVHNVEQRKVFSALRHYLPFLNMDVVYDNARLQKALKGQMPEIEPFASYAPTLLDLIPIEVPTEA